MGIFEIRTKFFVVVSIKYNFTSSVLSISSLHLVPLILEFISAELDFFSDFRLPSETVWIIGGPLMSFCTVNLESFQSTGLFSLGTFLLHSRFSGSAFVFVSRLSCFSWLACFTKPRKFLSLWQDFPKNPKNLQTSTFGIFCRFSFVAMSFLDTLQMCGYQMCGWFSILWKKETF